MLPRLAKGFHRRIRVAVSVCVLLAIIATLRNVQNTKNPTPDVPSFSNASHFRGSKIWLTYSDPEKLTLAWKKAVKDETIACRLYDLPRNPYEKIDYQRPAPLDCASNGTKPWVRVEGDTSSAKD